MLVAQGGQTTTLGYLLGTARERIESYILQEDGTLRPIRLVVVGQYSEESRLQAFLSQHRMCMLVYAYEPGDSLSPAVATELPADPWTLPPHAMEPEPEGADRDRIPYGAARLRRSDGAGPDPSQSVLAVSLPRSSLRELGRNLQGLQHPIRYQFVVGTRSLSDGVVEIARSEMVDFSSPGQVTGAFGGMYVLSTTNETGFDVRMLQDPAEPSTAALESVVWSIAQDRFVDYAIMCISRAHHEQMAMPGVVEQAELEPE